MAFVEGTQRPTLVAFRVASLSQILSSTLPWIDKTGWFAGLNPLQCKIKNFEGYGRRPRSKPAVTLS